MSCARAASDKQRLVLPIAIAPKNIPSAPPVSPAPSTPDKSGRGTGFSFLADNPSTTPAGPPPSSAASFTPAGAPSDSYMGSSFMRGMTDTKPLSFGVSNNSSSGRNLFGRTGASSNPLGRSIRGRQPSGLSRQFSAADEEEEDQEEDQDAEGDVELPPPRGNLFRMSAAPDERLEDDEVDAEIERYIDQDIAGEEDERESYGEDDHAFEREESEEPDMFLNMRHDDRPYGQPMIGDESDLMMLNTPAATKRVRQEAESIFRQTSAHLGISYVGYTKRELDLRKTLRRWTILCLTSRFALLNYGTRPRRHHRYPKSCSTGCTTIITCTLIRCVRSAATYQALHAILYSGRLYDAPCYEEMLAAHPIY
ncbi:Uncharacterized protein HZ326_11229 [Fusarium oxysporum f. sp. albedinis]|nr:Uncharacterized protein HZ326_11229 [Fusarium oxysporum f. sp. albedinis]